MKKRMTVLMILMMMTGVTVLADDDHVTTRVIEIKDGKVFIQEDGKVVELDEMPKELLFDGGEMIKRGFLGVFLQGLTPELRDYFDLPAETGVLISAVTPDGPAAKAGLKAGDIVIAIDGEIMGSARDIGESIGDRKAGDQVRIEVNRKGETKQLFATLDERERPRFQIRRLPGELEWIGEHSGEAMNNLREYLESPEWKVRVNRLGDCEDLRVKLKALEQRLKELERELDKN